MSDREQNKVKEEPVPPGNEKAPVKEPSRAKDPPVEDPKNPKKKHL